MKAYFNFCFACLVTIVSFQACKEEPSGSKEIYPSDLRYQFIGTYYVIGDTNNYYMVVEKLDSNGEKYIKTRNFASIFPEITSEFNSIPAPLNLFDIGWHWGMKDNWNHTWDLTTGYNDTTTQIRENTLINSQIILYFRLQNTPWYGQDGVPYHDSYHKHIATKIN